MALTQISTNGIKDATIATADIADDAVTSAKIADDAITSALIADDAIVAAAIADNAVVTAAINADAVTGAKIADDAVGAEHIEVLDAALQFGDSVKAQFGGSNDLELYHDGSNSYIDNHQGDLFIRGEDDNIILQAVDGENSIKCNPNGSVHLYYDNVDKFSTTSDGVGITGTGTNTVEINGTGNHELYSYHDASGAGWATGSGGSFGELVYLNEANSVVAIYAAGETCAKFLGNGAVELRYDNVKKLETASTGVQITGYLGFESTGKVIHLADSREVVFGTGEDLKIYHDGNNSKITDSGTGILAIGGSAVYIEGADHGETMAKFTDDGACEFYHDNSKKFETTGDGAKLTSGSHLDFHDSSYIRMGDGSDLKFYSDGSNGILEGGGTGANAPILINANTVRLQTQSGGEKYVDCQENGAVELYYNNVKKFETYSSGAGLFGFLKLGLENGAAYKSRIGVADIVNQGSSYATLVSTGLGGLAFIMAYNDSGGNQYTALVAWRSGSHSVIHESDNTGLSVDYQTDGSALQIKTASGTISGSCTYLISA